MLCIGWYKRSILGVYLFAWKVCMSMYSRLSGGKIIATPRPGIIIVIITGVRLTCEDARVQAVLGE